MACWTIVFAKILADHEADYIAQRGDARARMQVLRDCRDEILQTSQANHMMLPDNFRAVSTLSFPVYLVVHCTLLDFQAIRQQFIKALPDSDREDEETAIQALETKKNSAKISAEEREAAARPQKAGEYRREWDTFRAAGRLFKDDLDAVDKSTRDQRDKSTFGKRTKTAHEWFDGLSKEKKREAEKVAIKWNQDGAPKQQQVV